MIARRIRRLLVALAALALAGCTNPFEPATPQRPNVANVRPNYATGQAVLTTLADAIGDKGTSNGASAYQDAFAADFIATVQSEVAILYLAQFGGTLPTWDLQRETLFYSSFVRLFPTDQYALSFRANVQLPADETDESDNQITLYRDYQVFATSADGTHEEVICQGNADITMTKSNGRWFISRWADHYDRAVGASPNDERFSWGSRRYESIAN